MSVTFISGMDGVAASAWEALDGAAEPFLSHAFLAALEHHQAASAATGWRPCHALLREPDGALLAACPGYLKDHSWGEFVFDWMWANASERLGEPYYPKWVCAVPFTPATGPRLLTRADAPAGTRRRLVEGIREWIDEHGLSSGHWLFPRDDEHDPLRNAGLVRRLGCQYHWINQGWSSWEAFLAALRSRRRKEIRRERRQVAEQGFRLTTHHGSTIPEDSWRAFHEGYCTTFLIHGNMPVLSLAFFREIARRLGDAVVMFEARHEGRPVAAALCFRSHDTLYGRYWAATVEAEGLHFEACYYQGIEYCIEHGLQRFEPGAQGEHKIPRGFRPVPTYSWHHVRHPVLRQAVQEYAEREEAVIAERMRSLDHHHPFHRDAS